VNKLSLLSALLFLSCSRVAPGYVGIKVNNYGDQKGVEDFPLQTGRVTYNPFTTDVYTFPTFRQNVIWEGEDESITFNSTEGSVINADVGLSYSLDGEKVPQIFVAFRQDIEHITHVFVRSEVRDALARHAGKYKVTDIFGPKKQDLLDEVKADVIASLGGLGFKFEMISFVGALRCDGNVMESINATIQATQLAISAQNKVVQATAEANQAIETARGAAESVKLAAAGEAESIKLRAVAQAEANRLVAASLTPELVQWRAIEKWDGVQPTFMGGGTGMIPLVQVSK